MNRKAFKNLFEMRFLKVCDECVVYLITFNRILNLIFLTHNIHSKLRSTLFKNGKF
jgi:hypothetical protein